MKRLEKVLRQIHRQEIHKALKLDEDGEVVLTDWKLIKGLADWWW